MREQRTLLSQIERRSKKRGRGTDADNSSTISSFSSSRQRRRMYEDHEDEKADNCAICRDSLAVGPTVNLPCGHNFHSVCHRNLLNNGDERCPLCRQCTLCDGECTACSDCHQHEGHSDSCLRIVEEPSSPSNGSISSLAGRLGGGEYELAIIGFCLGYSIIFISS